MTLGLLTLFGVWLGATITGGRGVRISLPPPHMIANTTPPTWAEINAAL